MKSIRSIQNQSFKNIEIIIVYDFSTDDSKNVFEYLLETDPRIRIFSNLKNMVCGEVDWMRFYIQKQNIFFCLIQEIYMKIIMF